jgi:prolyl oligopeptidase
VNNTTLVDDPYLWLEDVDGEAALNWVRAQNAVSKAELEAHVDFAPLRDRFQAILDSDAKIPYVTGRGGWLYNFWRDAVHVRGVWRRCTLESYRLDKPAWEVIIDLDALAAQENENWVWHGAMGQPKVHQRLLVYLSRGGSDASVVREFDLETKRFVQDGFYLPEAKSRVDWIDQDTIFVGTSFGEGSLTTSGYPRICKIWRRGQALEEAQTIFEGQAEDVSIMGYTQDHAETSRLFVGRSPDFFTSELFWLSNTELKRLDKPISAEARAFEDWILLELKENWTTNEQTYRQGSLIVSRFEDAFAGQAQWHVLFEPNERSALQNFSMTKNYIVLNVLENVQNKVWALRFDGQVWNRTDIDAPQNATIQAYAVDKDQGDQIFLNVTGFLTPSSLMLTEVGSSQIETLKENPTFFDAAGLKVQQLEAESKDGTRVPYFLVSKENLEFHGSNPTMLYGYGGFEVTQMPMYSGLNGAGWFERGGVYVLANIRGGGEFGPRWHRAALRENRQRAYDDFIAVAEDLIERGITSSPHLSIRGGSNGGLLMGAMITQRPDLFGAVHCAVPLLDMKRYNKLLAGASWMAEYGDPDNPEDWAFISKYSPYQNLFPDRKYPRTFFTTSTKDDRVHPGHARKMMARMLEQGHDVLYYENIEGGHGGAANNAQTAHLIALEYTFLWHELHRS